MIIVNFKRYVRGEEAVALARICKKFGAITCPQLADLAACVETGAECWTQKYEPMAKGHTGTLLNHSDFRLDFKTIEETMLELEGIKICVCCKDVEEGIKIDGKVIHELSVISKTISTQSEYGKIMSKKISNDDN